MDVSRGRLCEKLDRLSNEIDHAECLLKELGALAKLEGDLEMVGRLIRKLPG